MTAVLAGLRRSVRARRSESIVASDAELIAEFVAARTEHRAHTPPSERQGTPLGLAEAYRLQDLLRETLTRARRDGGGLEGGLHQPRRAGRVPA